MPLDDEERLHIALLAVRQGKHDEAIEHLKAVLETEPDNGVAHFLLGATYAEIAMPERAEASMRAALEHAPDLHIARLQLGLLLIKLGRSEAVAELEPLLALPQVDELHWFGRALQHVSQEDAASAIEAIERGLACEVENPDLHDSMRSMLERLRSADDAPVAGGLGAYADRD